MSDASIASLRDTHEFGVDNVGTVISVVIGSGVALLALYMGPILVGGYIAKLAVSESRAGLIISTEMSGFTLGAVIFFVIAGINWRRIVMAALLAMIAGNVLLLFADKLFLFVACRFFAGFGAGVVMTMTIQVIALMRDPDRVYGLWAVGQLSLGALGMIFFPNVISGSGINVVFLIWALLAACLFLTVRFYPTGREKDENPNPGGSPVITHRLVLGLWCLLGLFIYYSGQAGVWAYMERVGISLGIGQGRVANTLFASLIAGIAGAGLAILLGNRAGRALPLSTSMIMSAISIVLLIQSSSPAMFIVAACMFNFSWYLFLPYISAIVAAVDENGKLLTGLAVAFPAALAAGPAIAAFLLDDADTLIPCLLYGLVSVPVGLILILPAARFQVVKKLTGRGKYELQTEKTR